MRFSRTVGIDNREIAGDDRLNKDGLRVTLSWAIWISNSLLQWALLALVLRRNRWRPHPAFAVYIAICACKTSLLMWVSVYRAPLYFSINSGMRLVGLPLMVAVLVEVFAAVFRPYSTLPKGTLHWFKIAFGALVLLVAAAAIYFPGAAPGNIINTVFLLNRSASILFCGGFAFTALASSYFGIPWQTRTYGIGTGFLLFMSVDLVASSLQSVYAYAVCEVLGVVSMLAYTLALITWIAYFSKPDNPSHALTLDEMRRLQGALDYPSEKAESFRSSKQGISVFDSSEGEQ
jgi:hypothetical protein